MRGWTQNNIGTTQFSRHKTAAENNNNNNNNNNNINNINSNNNNNNDKTTIGLVWIDDVVLGAR